MKTTLLVILLTIIAKLFGFARNIVLSYFFGASAVSDAYLVALSIPEVLYDFVIIGISTSFIPIFSQVRKNEGEEASLTYTNNVINHILVFTGFLFVFGFIFSEPLVKIFASGFYGQRLSLTIELTRLVLFSMFFTSMVTIFNSYLQQQRNFVTPALVGIPLNLTIIFGIIIAYYTNPVVLGISYSVATLSQLFFILPAARKKGFRYQRIFDTKNPYLHKLFQIALPVMIGTSVNQINVLVNRTISSRLAVGSISALNYSYQLVFFVQSVFALSISNVIFPIISDYAVEKRFTEFKAIIRKSISLIYLIVFPMTVGAVIFPEQIIDLLFGRGNFDETAIRLTAYSLIGYAIGMLANAFREVLSRSFYALGDSRTPMKNAMFGVVVNVILAAVLSQSLGVMGLSLASSIAASVTSLLLLIQIRHKVGRLNLSSFLKTVIKATIAGIVMGAACLFSYNFFIQQMPPVIALILAIIIGAVSYVILLIVLRESEVSYLITKAKNLLLRKE